MIYSVGHNIEPATYRSLVEIFTSSITSIFVAKSVNHSGKAAGGLRIRWYNIRCDDDMVQVKTVISESNTNGIGEYMCMRLKRQENDVLGFIVRESKS